MSRTDPICFRCVHFKQHQPLHFRTPGECKWTPNEAVPDWFQVHLDSTDYYHGPKREVSTVYVIKTCAAFKEKPDELARPSGS